MSIVLIVEPNLIEANRFKDQLERAGWSVMVADSLADAVKIMARPVGDRVQSVLLNRKLFPDGDATETLGVEKQLLFLLRGKASVGLLN